MGKKGKQLNIKRSGGEGHTYKGAKKKGWILLQWQQEGSTVDLFPKAVGEPVTGQSKCSHLNAPACPNVACVKTHLEQKDDNHHLAAPF